MVAVRQDLQIFGRSLAFNVMLESPAIALNGRMSQNSLVPMALSIAWGGIRSCGNVVVTLVWVRDNC